MLFPQLEAGRDHGLGKNPKLQIDPYTLREGFARKFAQAMSNIIARRILSTQ
jgi:hypothetical protein